MMHNIVLVTTRLRSTFVEDNWFAVNALYAL